MSCFLQQLFGHSQGFWTWTIRAQRILIGGLILAGIGVFIIILFRMNKPNFKALYSGLFPDDAAKIVAKLQAEKQPYKIEDNGATIMVPEDKVYGLRLNNIREGVLVGHGISFEIFDKLKDGQTDFVQMIHYQSVLQNELSRTISEFLEVDRAKVHLVIPNKNFFIEKQTDPSAFIVLKLKEGKKMEQVQIQSVVNLVALSVEGLDKSHITITDTYGRRIYVPIMDKITEDLTATQMEYRNALQHSLEWRIEEILSSLVGAGRVIVKVNADVDFNWKATFKEPCDQNKIVVRSEQQHNEEAIKDKANTESSVFDTNCCGDGIAGVTSQQQSRLELQLTNLEINSDEKQIIRPAGELRRLSVAVIVDGSYAKGVKNELIFVPRKDEDRARFKQLIRNAIGFDSERGDVFEVVFTSFGGPVVESKPSLIRLVTDYLVCLGKPLLNALLIFSFLVIVVRPVVLALIRMAEGAPAVNLKSLSESDTQLVLTEVDKKEDEALDVTKKIEDIKVHVMQVSESNMEKAVAIVKSWLKQAETTRG
ncbi:Flagellar M-ring protein [Desulfovibrionales bacterium]